MTDAERDEVAADDSHGHRYGTPDPGGRPARVSRETPGAGRRHAGAAHDVPRLPHWGVHLGKLRGCAGAPYDGGVRVAEAPGAVGYDAGPAPAAACGGPPTTEPASTRADVLLASGSWGMIGTYCPIINCACPVARCPWNPVFCRSCRRPWCCPASPHIVPASALPKSIIISIIAPARAGGSACFFTCLSR